MATVDLIASLMADIDPATLPMRYLKSIRYTDAIGRCILITDKGDIKDFLDGNPRFGIPHDPRIFVDYKLLEDEWRTEWQYMFERINWLIKTDGKPVSMDW